MTGISQSQIQNFKNEKDREIACDDILHIQSYDCEFLDFKENYEPQEVEVVFRSQLRNVYQGDINDFNASDASPTIQKKQRKSNQGGKHNFKYSSDQIRIQIPEEIKSYGNPKVSKAFMSKFANISMGDSSPSNLIRNQFPPKIKFSGMMDYSQYNIHETQVFIMKIVEMRFMGGRQTLNIVGLRRKPMVFNVMNSHNLIGNAIVMESIDHNQKQNQNYGSINENMDILGGAKNSNSSIGRIECETPATGTSRQKQSSVLDDYHIEIASQSSSASISSSNSSDTINSTYSQQVNSDATPKTLKFILNMFLIMILVMFIASTVVLSISLSNLNYTLISLTVCKNSIETMNELTTIRFILRSLINIYQGNEFNSNQYINDRSTLYEKMILDVNTDMRKDQIVVTSLGETTTDGVEIANLNIPTFFLSNNGDQFELEQSLNQGITLLHNKVIDLVTEPNRKEELGRSRQPYLNLTTAALKKDLSYENLSLMERDAFILINNTNGNLYEELKSFTPKFKNYQVDKIDRYRSQLAGICLGLMISIILSSFVLIPLFGRVENRVLELMKIFLQIDPEIKLRIITRVYQFKEVFISQEQTADKKDGNYMKKLGKITSKLLIKKQRKDESVKQPSGSAPEEVKDQRRLKESQGDKKKSKKGLGEVFGITKQTKGKKGNRDEIIELGNIMKGEENYDFSSSFNEKKLQKKQEQQKSSESDEEVEARKTKKERDDQMQEINMQNQTTNIKTQEKDDIKEFSKFTNKRKLVQGIAIIVLLIFMASYYLIKYILSNKLQTSINYSMDDQRILYDRLSCSQNILNFYTESYFITRGTNYTDTKIRFTKYFEDLNQKINDCMLQETVFQNEIVNNAQDYLDGAYSQIHSIESGDLCNSSSIGLESCQGLTEQIRKQGLMTYYFNIMKSIKQMQLDLSSMLMSDRYNATFAKNQLQTKISIYLDTMNLVLYPAQEELQQASHASIYKYFENHGTIFSIIYGCYFACTLIVCLVFILSIYQLMRREMLLSNRLLYIIDFSSLKDHERGIILKFLQNY